MIEFEPHGAEPVTSNVLLSLVKTAFSNASEA